MPSITVAGSNGVVTLQYDSASNAALAKLLGGAITSGVDAGTIIPSDSKNGPPPALPTGKTGEFVQSTDGVTALPTGYKDVVVTASEAVIFGSGDANEAILSSQGDLTFFARGGSGSVVAGGGNNRISVPGSDNGNWLINTGGGTDDIFALGGGNDSISTGPGENTIQLGSGNDLITSTGHDRIVMGTGNATVAAMQGARDVVYGGTGNLLFIAGSGPSTIVGGTGSDTFLGGSGAAQVQGGSGGNNLLIAGTSAATLFGGGNGDTLFGSGNVTQALHAAGGNATLFGGFGADSFYAGSGSDQMFGGGGNDTFVASTGAATITGGFGTNIYDFINGQAGGTDLVTNFTSGDKIDLQGYGHDAVANALASQQSSPGSVMITLADNTQVTFLGVTQLKASDFVASGAGAAGTQTDSSQILHPPTG